MAKTHIEGATVVERVKEILVNQLCVNDDQVTPGSNLRDDLDADSLDMVEIVMKLEEEFDIEINEEAGDAMKTMQDAVDIVEKRIVKK